VKTNMVHTLHRVKAVGNMPLDSFKDLLTKEEFRKCASNPHLGKAWFKLTSEVFHFLLLLDNIHSPKFISFPFSLYLP
jgi:hypothetical protein